MLGIVRTQPPTGSPYTEPGVVKRMAQQRPVYGSGQTGVTINGGAGLGLVATHVPLPGSQFPAGQEPWVVAAMARNLPPSHRNFTDIPSHPLASNGAVVGIGLAGIVLALGATVGTIALGVYAYKKVRGRDLG